MSSAVVKPLNNYNEFRQAIEGYPNKKLVVLEFVGPNTYPWTCNHMKPFVETLARDHGDKVNFYELDADTTFKNLAMQLKVEALPTFLLVKDKNVKKRIVGTQKEELKQSIDDVVNP
ncbi:unnamed protein product [Urochloa decumbens]|uniref:Thioredoxin domain-containing protein n=1 Tax=Urochloa decumbens TaxID=240449 RepID=A0ABC9BZ84_9POAL